MNYEKIYNDLMQKRKIIPYIGYSERHHIIPKCMGGDNSQSNLVNLSAREHFIAHLLLCKIYPSNGKLFYAANMMTVNNKNQIRNNSKNYDFIKIKINQLLSERNQGKTFIYNPETNTTAWHKKIDTIPEGWIAGSGQQNNINKKRFYNPEIDMEIVIDPNECTVDSGFKEGRRPCRRLYSKNGKVKWDTGEKYDLDIWFDSAPQNIKIVNICTGETRIIKDVDVIPDDFLISKMDSNRNLSCVHLETKQTAMLTKKEYFLNVMWIRTQFKNDNILYITDVGKVRNKQEYERITGRNINIKKYCNFPETIISKWLINRCNLPKNWLGLSWKELGFGVIKF